MPDNEQDILETPFVGTYRKQFVGKLFHALDLAEKEKRPHLVALEAPTGWGKTRIAQEFYKELAKERNDNCYWPSSILHATDPDKVASPCTRRKCISPDPKHFVAPAGAIPQYMWVGVACGQQNGEAQSPFEHIINQIEAHKNHLSVARSEIALPYEDVKAYFAKKWLFLSYEAADYSGIIEGFLGHLPAAGPLIKEGFKELSKRHLERKEVALGGRLKPEIHTHMLFKLAVEYIYYFAMSGLPLIIFFEDFQFATEETRNLVIDLLKLDAPILMLVTYWKHRSTNDFFAKKIEEFSLEDRYELHSMSMIGSKIYASSKLRDLEIEDRREIIRCYFPGTDSETLDRISERLNTPLLLELLFGLPDYRDQKGKPLNLYDRLDALPSRLKDLYRKQWEIMDHESQHYLILAYLSSPEASKGWHRRLTDKPVLDSCGNRLGLAKYFSPENVPFGWAESILDWLAVFGDPHYVDIIKDAKENYEVISRSEEKQYIETLIEKLEATDFSVEDDTNDEIAHFARIAVMLYRLHGKSHNVGIRLTPLRILSAINYLAQNIFDNRLEKSEIFNLGELAQMLAGDSENKDEHNYLCKILRNVSLVYREYGNIDLAIKNMELVTQISSKVFGSGHSSHLRDCGNLAALYSEMGKHEIALKKMRVLLPVLEDGLGVHSVEALSVRCNIIKVKADKGAIDTALSEAMELQIELERYLSKDHYASLVNRRNIGVWQAKRGDFEAAIQLGQQLLLDMAQVLGKNHQDYFDMKKYFIKWSAEAGAREKAISDLKKLLIDQECELGKDHPDCLDTRAEIACLLGKMGDLKAALLLFEEVRSEQGRILGKEHADYLRTCSHIATTYGRLGRVDESLAAFKKLLVDYDTIVGINHPETMKTLFMLIEVGEFLAKRGRYLDARHALKAALIELEGRHYEDESVYEITADRIEILCREIKNWVLMPINDTAAVSRWLKRDAIDRNMDDQN